MYSLKTAILRRVSQYSGLDFKEVLNLPYSYFLLLNKESWISSYQTSKDGLELLKNLWRLRQTEADEKAIKEYTGKAGD